MDTAHGRVRVKLSDDGAFAPEYDDCRRLALEQNVPLKQIMIAATTAALASRVEMSKYYLTTPIYYVNAAPHIGHAYTTIAADAIARLKRMQGFDAYLTTGTDEHGQRSSAPPRPAARRLEDFTDTISAEFRKQWEQLEPARSTASSAPPARSTLELCRTCSRRCLANGYVYKGSYTGQYCVYDELYVNDAKPGDPCPDCGRPTETSPKKTTSSSCPRSRTSCSSSTKTQPDFIQPETRRNEVIAFVKQGLNDLSISRTTIKWGIPFRSKATTSSMSGSTR